MPTDHWCAWFELVGQVASYQLRMVRYGYTTATEKSSKNLRSPLGGTEGALFQQLTLLNLVQDDLVILYVQSSTSGYLKSISFV